MTRLDGTHMRLQLLASWCAASWNLFRRPLKDPKVAAVSLRCLLPDAAPSFEGCCHHPTGRPQGLTAIRNGCWCGSMLSCCLHLGLECAALPQGFLGPCSTASLCSCSPAACDCRSIMLTLAARHQMGGAQIQTRNLSLRQWLRRTAAGTLLRSSSTAVGTWRTPMSHRQACRLSSP